MSISSDILTYLAAQPAHRLGSIGAQQIAGDLGQSAEKISKLLWSLEHTKRLSLIRDGRNIVGIDKLLRIESKYERGEARPRAKRVVEPGRQALTVEAIRRIKTPNLDRYAQAKRRADEFTIDDEFVTIAFRENQLAEEALKIRQALLDIGEKYAELSTNFRMLKYQYDTHMDGHKRNVEAKVHEFRAQAQGD